MDRDFCAWIKAGNYGDPHCSVMSLLNQVKLLSQQVWMPGMKMSRWNAPMAPSAPWSTAYYTVLTSLKKCWSAALVHTVYLKNRLFHKALHTTPYEEWMGVKPILGHLHTFVTLITTRKPGKRSAKADRHTVFYLASFPLQSTPGTLTQPRIEKRLVAIMS
jgi:hypothetical protein